MTRDDRFGLKGDPEIQGARRHFRLPLWLSLTLALALVLWGAAVLLRGEYWPRLLGVIGVVAALLGAVAASKARVGLPQPQQLFRLRDFMWFFLSFLASTQGQELDRRLKDGSLAAWDWFRFSTLVFLMGALIWQFLASRRHTPR